MSEAEEFPTIVPEYDITVSKKEDFQKILLDQIHTGVSEINIDLINVKLIDSTGIGILIAAYNQLKQKGGTINVINISGDIMKMFKILRLDQHFNVSETE